MTVDNTWDCTVKGHLWNSSIGAPPRVIECDWCTICSEVRPGFKDPQAKWDKDVRQVVQVKFPETVRHYTYEWLGGMPLMIGDIVMVPPNALNDEPSRATVVAYGSLYDGPMASILEKVQDE